jgi:acyl-CoA synthetase (AMP-forming)/AMP-acid ligase II
MTLLHELLDRTASDRPDATAISHGTTTLTYRELDQASRRIAGWLTGRGVGRGDRVVIALPTDPIVPALLYGCSRVGAVFIVLHEQVPEVTLAHVLADSEPVLVITDKDEVHPFDAPFETPTVLDVDPVCLIYTSGSTGMPKAVVSTHAQATFAVAAIQSQLGYRPDDVVFCALPLSFDYGMYQVFLSTVGGSHLRLAPASAAGPQLLGQLNDCGATVLPAVPGLAKGLARLLSRPRVQVPPLRLLTNTGAAMPVPALADLRRQIPGLHVQLMFGLTECKRATIMPVDEDLRRPGASGKALPGTEVFTIDADGRRLPAGEVGEIVVRGPNVMAGYWRRPELTAQRFHRADGLFPQLRTGDYGWLDEDGFLYFAGRRDDVYKENGFRVSATEVEAAAHRVTGVDGAAVLPPGADGEGATLFVRTELEPHEVLDRLRTELEAFKVPHICLVVPEIPLTRNGKIDRAELSRMLSDGSHV